MILIENENGKVKECQFIKLIDGEIIDTEYDDLQRHALKEPYGWIADKNYLWYTERGHMIRCLGRIVCGLSKLPKE